MTPSRQMTGLANLESAGAWLPQSFRKILSGTSAGQNFRKILSETSAGQIFRKILSGTDVYLAPFVLSLERSWSIEGNRLQDLGHRSAVAAELMNTRDFLDDPYVRAALYCIRLQFYNSDPLTLNTKSGANTF